MNFQLRFSFSQASKVKENFIPVATSRSSSGMRIPSTEQRTPGEGQIKDCSRGLNE
jgi:hypothetical protein